MKKTYRGKDRYEEGRSGIRFLCRQTEGAASSEAVSSFLIVGATYHFPSGLYSHVELSIVASARRRLSWCLLEWLCPLRQHPGQVFWDILS